MNLLLEVRFQYSLCDNSQRSEDMTTTKLLSDLSRTENEILKYFDLSKEELQKSNGPNKWNVKQILHHISDAESVLLDRIKRAISKPGQVVWGFDQDAWADGLEYESRPLAMSKSLFLAVRMHINYLAENYYERLGDNFYIHNETGNRTLKEEFEKVVWHADGHLTQIKKALDQ